MPLSRDLGVLFLLFPLADCTWTAGMALSWACATGTSCVVQHVPSGASVVVKIKIFYDVGAILT
jgi:hypothetical protein